MAKRKLSKQQQRRIASQQKNKIKDDDLQLDESSTQTARVISHHGRQLYAETENLEKIKCKIRQNLGNIACGDYVLVQQVKDASSSAEDKTQIDSQNVVVAIKQRSNLLVKTGFAGATKPVAANIGQLVIVTSLKPKPNPYLIDRYLTAAENLPAKALIIINKVDLLDYESKRIADDMTCLYENIGYRVISSSVKQGIGIKEIMEALSNTTSILVGLSGVGKSSIVKAILPKEAIKIGETSESTGEGKHTTTVSALYHLKGNGIIIDSPGVRDFTPINKSLDEITHGFIDVRRFNGACKFSNCSHHHEPGCTMTQAVKDGELNEQRFNNYLRLIDEFNEQ
jgi:ribosome biogenesis GTPase / thiamine phosphate phosphatase